MGAAAIASNGTCGAAGESDQSVRSQARGRDGDVAVIGCEA